MGKTLVSNCGELYLVSSGELLLLKFTVLYGPDALTFFSWCSHQWLLTHTKATPRKLQQWKSQLQMVPALQTLRRKRLV